MNVEPEIADPIVTPTTPNGIDSANDPPPHAARPGDLRGAVSLLIQTRQAQRLVYGRAWQNGRPEIIGLLRFGQLMRRIWNAAADDDPFADWYLIRILETLEETRAGIQTSRGELRELLGTCQQMEIAIAQSISPLRMPLQFANPYGYLGAYLISDYDELVCAVLTARHVALVSRGRSDQILQQSAGRVRGALASPLGWKHLGITRDDLRQDNARARQARNQMGEPPEDILEGECRARIAPAIRNHSPVVGESQRLPKGPFYLPFKGKGRTLPRKHRKNATARR